jgi:hypothetical protein
MYKQLVGKICALCKEPIIMVAQGEFCNKCENPIHYNCIGHPCRPVTGEPCSYCGSKVAPPSPAKTSVATDFFQETTESSDIFSISDQVLGTDPKLSPLYDESIGRMIIFLAIIIFSSGILVSYYVYESNKYARSFILAMATIVASYLFKIGRKLHSEPASEVIADDLRPPILLLRSFQDDEAWPVSSPYQIWTSLVLQR